MYLKGYEIACLQHEKIFVFFDKKLNQKNLINDISKITNLNFSCFEIIELKNLPRTSNNKISYNKLKNDRL